MKKSTKVIIWLIVILLIGIGSWYFWPKVPVENQGGQDVGGAVYLPGKTVNTSTRAFFQKLCLPANVGSCAAANAVSTSTLTIPVANAKSVMVLLTAYPSSTATIIWSYWYAYKNTPRDWYPEGSSSTTIKNFNLVTPSRAIYSWTPSASNNTTITTAILVPNIGASYLQVRFSPRTASSSIHAIGISTNIVP